MLLTSCGLTDTGLVRSVNQDRIVHEDALGLYAVCDGIGGRRRGEIAAEIAASVLKQYIESSTDPIEISWPYGYKFDLSLAGNRLLTAAQMANRQVWRKSEEALEFLGMGTTIAAVLIGTPRTALVNIGDSRIYLWRNGRLEQLSVDDTLAGDHSSAAPVLQPLSHILTRAAGSQETASFHVKECALEDGDWLLLSSDGLHGCLPDRDLRVIFQTAGNVEDAAAGLLKGAYDAGAPDNISLVLLHYRI